MLGNIYQFIRKRYRIIKVFLQPHPVFGTLDRIKLSKIKPNFSKKGFYLLHPKGWNHSIKIRKHFIDKEVVEYVLYDKYHLPPIEISLGDNSIILDLGSNIGLTIAHLKQLYPKAIIFGYEMNTENYLLAKRNTKAYTDVHVYNNAVWTENTIVEYSGNSNYDAYSISHQKNNEHTIKIQGVTIMDIIKQHKLKKIDYLKMDIEGAEKDILNQQDLSWLQYVNSLNIEMHINEEEEINTYINILNKNGFHAWKDDKHWSSIKAIRK